MTSKKIKGLIAVGVISLIGNAALFGINKGYVFSRADQPAPAPTLGVEQQYTGKFMGPQLL